MYPSETQAYCEGVEACRHQSSDLFDNPYAGNDIGKAYGEDLAAIWEDGYEDCLATGSIKKNLMTGKRVFVTNDTPMVCDPSTETYWCK